MHETSAAFKSSSFALACLARLSLRMKKPNSDYDEAAAMQAAQERSGEPHLRDILKREHDEAQNRPRDIALEKWGPSITEQLFRDLKPVRFGPEYYRPDRSPSPVKQPKRDGPDMD
jgi:hypothetical protein